MALTRMQYVSPLPPLRTGIASYSRDFLRAVDGQWSVDVLGEDESGFIPGSTLRPLPASEIDPELPLLLQMGNSEHHQQASHLGLKHRAILVLHDVVLHHAELARAVQDGNTRGYHAELAKRYGEQGVHLGQQILRGKMPLDLLNFPLSERYVERSRATVVHSEFARAQVKRRNPHANVIRVPMGIPLPVLIEREEARRRLHLPESAFVIASITHINPMKRIPVVLRALRILVSRMPDVMLIIAGSSSIEVDLERQIELLGLRRHVRVVGYVSDNHARLLARSADVCVNLRHPATGETSASLLRLLGAGRPVLVTDGPNSADLTANVALRVPVDRFEAEFISELLWTLAHDQEFREQAGSEARQFVEQHHSMAAMIAGYRRVIQASYGIDMPEIAGSPVVESWDAEDFPGSQVTEQEGASRLDRLVSSALVELGLGNHNATLERVASTMIDLRLDRLHKTRKYRDVVDIIPANLACPGCGGDLYCQSDCMICRECGRGYRIEAGIPLLIADQDTY